MTVVVDSSVLVDHLRDHATATEILLGAAESERRIVASVLTRIELRVGARAHQAPALESLLDLIDWYPVMEDVADLAAGYAQQWDRSHSGIDPVDYVIAATTTMLGAELWTSNIRHFPMFPDLAPPY